MGTPKMQTAAGTNEASRLCRRLCLLESLFFRAEQEPPGAGGIKQKKQPTFVGCFCLYVTKKDTLIMWNVIALKLFENRVTVLIIKDGNRYGVYILIHSIIYIRA